MGAIRETKKAHEFAPGVIVRSFESDLYKFEISWMDGRMCDFEIHPRKKLYHSISCSRTEDSYEFNLKYDWSFNYKKKDIFKENFELTIKFLEEDFIPFMNSLEPPKMAE